MNYENPDNDPYEGCGRLGPIRSIFFAEFHPIAGPMIRCQSPAKGLDVITKDVFEAISVFIIPKPQLARAPLTVNALDRKICGYPIILKDEKYKRNQFMFNVCFVCYPWSRTVQYEPALIKLSNFLVDLELADGFLYKEENTPKLQSLLDTVHAKLNMKGECITVVEKYTLMLKVISIKPDPKPVHDWDVPILMYDVELPKPDQRPSEDSEEWDLTTQQILPFIDGVFHCSRIAAEAGVETGLVRACIQNLLYHNVVDIVPIFMYSNVYCTTPRLIELRENRELRAKFMEAIKCDPPPDDESDEGEERPAPPNPPFSRILAMVSDFNNHTTVSDICQRFRPKENLNVDEGRLVQFLVMHGILRRVHKYPVYVPDANNVAGSLGASNVGGVTGAASDYYQFFNGQKTFDEICCRMGISPMKLEDKIDTDPNVYIIRK